jgi:long-chain fatty acid transport protein
MITIVLIATLPAYAGDTDTFGIGARAAALGGAVSADTASPFAVYYNPAGLSQIEDQVVSISVSALQPDIRFKNYHVSGSSDSTVSGYKSFSDESDPLYVPSIGYAGKINDRLAFGCALYAPWGLTLTMNDNPSENPGAYNAYESQYGRVGVTPSLSYRVTPKLSVGFGVTFGRSYAGGKNRMYVSNDMGSDFPEYGAGLTSLISNADAASQSMGGAAVTNTAEASYFYTQASENTVDPSASAEYAGYAGVLGAAYNYGILTAADTSGKASPSQNSDLDVDMVDEFNYSFNVGVMYQPTDIIRLGLTYRGRCKTDFEGDVSVDGSKVSNGHMNFDHPDQVQGGIHFMFPDKKLSIETDLVYTRWSIADTQTITLDRGLTVEIAPGVYETKTVLTTERDWNDSIQVRIGVEYILNDRVTLRFGHFYDPTPIPDKTLDFVHPDADKRTYSTGFGLHLDSWTLDGYLSFTTIEQEREIGGESTNLNGTYDTTGESGTTVSVAATGKIYGAGFTLSRNF